MNDPDAEAFEAERMRVRTEVFWRLHRDLPKQGPGSDASTRRALALAGPLPERPGILDLGCGPGRQSLVLAQATGGHVWAVDLLRPFLEQLERAARAAGLADRITTRQASMAELSDPDGAYDVIWSEGAIYNLGFSTGLRLWRRLLRPGGVLAVSEVVWLVDDPSPRSRAFWQADYPGIGHPESNRRQIRDAGYEAIGEFVLPARDWWDDYYDLIEERLVTLRDEREGAEWRAAIAEYDEELAVVRAGLAEFGYVFYVMRRS